MRIEAMTPPLPFTFVYYCGRRQNEIKVKNDYINFNVSGTNISKQISPQKRKKAGEVASIVQLPDLK